MQSRKRCRQRHVGRFFSTSSTPEHPSLCHGYLGPHSVSSRRRSRESVLSSITRSPAPGLDARPGESDAPPPRRCDRMRTLSADPFPSLRSRLRRSPDPAGASDGFPCHPTSASLQRRLPAERLEQLVGPHGAQAASLVLNRPTQSLFRQRSPPGSRPRRRELEGLFTRLTRSTRAAPHRRPRRPSRLKCRLT